MVPVLAFLVSLGIFHQIFIDGAAYLCLKSYQCIDDACTLVPLAFDIQHIFLFMTGSIVALAWVLIQYYQSF